MPLQCSGTSITQGPQAHFTMGWLGGTPEDMADAEPTRSTLTMTLPTQAFVFPGYR